MPRPRTLAALVSVLLLAALPVMLGTEQRLRPADLDYVGRRTCTRCHTEQDEHCQNSDHDRAMAVATDSTVLGRFDDAPIPHHGQSTTPRREADRFIVRTQSSSGTLADFPISHVFGVDPLQQYLVEFEDGRKQCLPIAWDTVSQRWLHLYPETAIPPSDPLHWTGRDQDWVTVRPTTSVFAPRRQDAARHGKTERATRGDRAMAAIL